MRHSRFAVAAFLGLVLFWTARTSTTNVVLVAKGSVWKFSDQGLNLGTAWRALAYVDSGWGSGNAQLGYGDGDESTVVSFGPNSSAKYVTTYFRQTFTVSDPSIYQSVTLNLLRDDGAVVYLNGSEVFRSNMPTGSVAYNTLASVAIGGADESTYYSVSMSPAALVAGSNILAVEVHQANGTSSDVSFDAELTASTSLQITRGPYLQSGTPTGVTVRWRTSGPSDSRVQYGLDPSSLIWTATQPALTTEHEVRLASLSPQTKYYYSVGSTTETIAGGDANYFFTTSPVTGAATPTRVWVLGDSGTADANARAVRDAYYAFAGNTAPNLWLMLGDNAYQQGLDTEFQAAVFDMYPSTLRQSVLWPTLGNHDGAAADSATGTGPYYDMFTLPKSGEAGGIASGTEAYYSFDYGNIHFICLESFETNRAVGGPMLTWLQNDLGATNQRWIVAYFHHPPYSKGSHDSDVDIEMREMRQNALPILEAGGVDLVLTGHSHSYERSFLIDGHYGLSSTFTSSMKLDGGSGREDGTGAYQKPTAGPAPHEGAVYAVAGSSGQTAGGTLNHPAMYVSMSVLGSMVLDVADNRLDAKFIDNTSAVRDYFTIVKGSTAVAPTITTSGFNDATIGVPYSVQASASGGTTPYTWTIASGQLPAGLSINSSSGLISGTPAGAAGTSPFDLRVTGADSLSSTKSLSIRVAAPLQITTSTLANGTVGTPYSQSVSATGGQTPYSWSTVAGALPAGLSLNALSGVISGTPTAQGPASFTVRAADSGSPSRLADRNLSITVGAASGPPGAFGKSSPANGAKSLNTSITLSWAASAGAASYEFCYDTTNDNSCAGTWMTAGTAQQASITSLARKTAYYWQVRAVNPQGTTLANAGTWWNFRTR